MLIAFSVSLSTHIKGEWQCLQCWQRWIALCAIHFIGNLFAVNNLICELIQHLQGM